MIPASSALCPQPQTRLPLRKPRSKRATSIRKANHAVKPGIIVSSFCALYGEIPWREGGWEKRSHSRTSDEAHQASNIAFIPAADFTDTIPGVNIVPLPLKPLPQGRCQLLRLLLRLWLFGSRAWGGLRPLRRCTPSSCSAAKHLGGREGAGSCPASWGNHPQSLGPPSWLVPQLPEQAEKGEAHRDPTKRGAEVGKQRPALWALPAAEASQALLPADLLRSGRA